MFYNPALLSKNKKPVLEIFNPHQEIGMGNFGIEKKTPDLWQQGKLGNAAPLLNAHKGKASSFDSSLYPYFAAQNFSLGFLIRGDTTAYVDNTSTLHYHAKYMVIPTLGLSAGMFSGRIKFGVAVRGVQLTEKDTSTTNLLNQGYQTDAPEGFGIALDAGSSFTLPWDFLPTVAVVARNIGGTSFPGSAPFYKFATGTAPHPDMIKSTYDVGGSLTPKIGRKTTLNLAGDFRDATNRYGVSTLRRVNLGGEIGFNKYFFLRGGISRGYWTSALGVTGKKATLDIGTYAEELSAKAFRVQEDRRVFIRFGGKF